MGFPWTPGNNSGLTAVTEEDDLYAAHVAELRAAVDTIEAYFSTFGKSLIDDTTASAARSTLDLGTLATLNAANITSKLIASAGVAITSSAASGKIIKSDASGNLQWQYNDSLPIFPVEKYGAVGNNVTDDTSAFNQAILAAYNAGGGIVSGRVSATYYIASTLNMKTHTLIDGLTCGFSIRLANISGGGIKFDGVDDAGLRNIHIDADAQVADKVAVYVSDSTNIGFENVNVEDAGGFGIFVVATGTNTTDRVKIVRCKLSGKGNNDVIGGGPANSTGAVVSGVSVIDCDVEQDASQGRNYTNAIDLVAPYQLAFRDNRTKGNITFGNEQSPCRFADITLNRVNPAIGKTSGGIFVLIDVASANPGKSVQVDLNNVENGWIYIQNLATSDALYAVSALGNNVYADGADRAAGFGGIKFLNVSNGIVGENLVFGSTSDGIQINGSTNCLIASNKIDGSDYYGIIEDSDSDGNYYLGNVLTNNTSGTYSLNGTNQTLSSVEDGKHGFGVASPTSVVDIAASTTSRASLRLRSGVAPTSPNDGDVWFDGTAFKVRIAGVTKTITVI